MPIYNESESEYHLCRAAEMIESAQQLQKREIKKKDDIIQNLSSKLDMLQFERNREHIDIKRLREKERELVCANNTLKHRLSIQETENQRLQDELERIKQDLDYQVDQKDHFEQEHEKAKHVIKNLLKKVSHSSQTNFTPPQRNQHHLPNHLQTRTV